MTIVEFLTACYDDFERAAKAAIMHAAHADAPEGIADWSLSGLGEDNIWAEGVPIAVGPFDGGVGGAAEHIALNDPAFVLADIAAKRRLIAEYEEAKFHYEAEHDVDGSAKYSDGGVWEFWPSWRSGRRCRKSSPCPSLIVPAMTKHGDHEAATVSRIPLGTAAAIGEVA